MALVVLREINQQGATSTSYDLAKLPKMEMGLVPPLGGIGAGVRGWTVQVAEERATDLLPRKSLGADRSWGG